MMYQVHSLPYFSFQGQAQECLLEKSILDSRKDSLVARISMQVCWIEHVTFTLMTALNIITGIRYYYALVSLSQF